MNSQIPRKHKTQLQARMGNPDLPHLNQRHPEQHRADRWHTEWDMRPHWLARHSQKKKNRRKGSHGKGSRKQGAKQA